MSELTETLSEAWGNAGPGAKAATVLVPIAVVAAVAAGVALGARPTAQQQQQQQQQQAAQQQPQQQEEAQAATATPAGAIEGRVNLEAPDTRVTPGGFKVTLQSDVSFDCARLEKALAEVGKSESTDGKRATIKGYAADDYAEAYIVAAENDDRRLWVVRIERESDDVEVMRATKETRAMIADYRVPPLDYFKASGHLSDEEVARIQQEQAAKDKERTDAAQQQQQQQQQQQPQQPQQQAGA